MLAQMYRTALTLGFFRGGTVLVNLFPLDKVILAQSGAEFTPPRYDTLVKTDSRFFQVAIYLKISNMIYHGEYRVLNAPIS
jgi:hypothetical protein